MLLVEIAIVARINFRLAAHSEPNPGSLTCEVPARILPSGVPTACNQDQWLENLQQRTPRGAGGHVERKYDRAVEECFKMRDKVPAHGDSELLVAGLKRCVETILQPCVISALTLYKILQLPGMNRLEDHRECLREQHFELGQAIPGTSYLQKLRYQ